MHTVHSRSSTTIDTCSAAVRAPAMARAGPLIALLVSTLLTTTEAGGSCGGFDLDNAGQAGQCLDDDDSPNGESPPA